MCEGRVLFHSHVHKSAEESVAQQEEVDERDRLKAERRRQQVHAHAASAPSISTHAIPMCLVLPHLKTWRGRQT